MRSSLNYPFPQNQAYWPAATLQDFTKAAYGKLRSIKQNMLSELTASLTGAPEPTVWQSKQQKKQEKWSAYNPVSGKTVHNLSETEMRVWLEKHYQC